jgi:tetratricopeptide (TPR) repeat protein
MKFDRCDTILTALLLASIVSLALLTLRAAPGGAVVVESRRLERELAAQSRQVLLDRLFAPVTAALQAGQYQEALLKLEEVNVRYPGEAHGFILKGEILDRMGLADRAAASFVKGVKLNGDYIDRHSPVTRREVIAGLVERRFAAVAAAYRATPGSGPLKETLADFNYLKSRLAGGCE